MKTIAHLVAATALYGLFAFAGALGSATVAGAQVYLPCAPNCTVDPCKLAPERCK